jgi:hypothetical protein
MRKHLKNANRDRLVTLSDDQLDLVSGGWGPGFGVLTAMTHTSSPPAVYNIVTNKAGITVGVGFDTAASAKV